MLSRDQVRRFYDRFGSRQDSQAFYEDPAVDALVRASRFGAAQRILEIGCGTGRFAERLLARELPRDACYLGIDISSTMVGLAAARLRRFGERAEVRLADGRLPLARGTGSVDRLVSTYVADLLPDAEIADLFGEARRLLAPGGRLCLTGLTHGPRGLSRLVSRAWSALHAWRPALVGGCRPVDLSARLPGDAWRIEHHEVVIAWGVPSEVLVASPAAATA